jgi:hypothetical protein
MKKFIILMLPLILLACSKFNGIANPGTWQLNEPAKELRNPFTNSTRTVEPPKIVIALTDKPDKIQVQGQTVYLNEHNFKLISPTEIVLDGKNYIFLHPSK